MKDFRLYRVTGIIDYTSYCGECCKGHSGAELEVDKTVEASSDDEAKAKVFALMEKHLQAECESDEEDPEAAWVDPTVVVSDAGPIPISRYMRLIGAPELPLVWG